MALDYHAQAHGDGGDDMDWFYTPANLANHHSLPFSQSCFGQLPGEVRNQIYELAIPPDNGSEVHRGSTHLRARPSLTQVCQQLRLETLARFFVHTDLYTPVKTLALVEVCRDAIVWSWPEVTDRTKEYCEELTDDLLHAVGYPLARAIGHVVPRCRDCGGEVESARRDDDHVRGVPEVYLRWQAGSRRTGMCAHYAWKCLDKAEWDTHVALGLFERARPIIPPDAYLESKSIAPKAFDAVARWERRFEPPRGMSMDAAVYQVVELAELTGMKLKYAIDCLVVNDFDLDEAYIAFMTLTDELPEYISSLGT